MISRVVLSANNGKSWGLVIVLISKDCHDSVISYVLTEYSSFGQKLWI